MPSVATWKFQVAVPATAGAINEIKSKIKPTLVGVPQT